MVKFNFAHENDFYRVFLKYLPEMRTPIYNLGNELIV